MVQATGGLMILIAALATERVRARATAAPALRTAMAAYDCHRAWWVTQSRKTMKLRTAAPVRNRKTGVAGPNHRYGADRANPSTQHKATAKVAPKRICATVAKEPAYLPIQPPSTNSSVPLT